jgi:cell division protein FtsQ
MIRGKPNRRRVERRFARLAWPKFRFDWGRRAVVVPVLLGGALLAVAGGARALLDRPVRQLVVEGTFQRVTPIQIEEAVAGNLERGFLSLDLGAVRARVQSLDWVDEVEVGRAWPDTVIVRITEHQAAARWGETGLLNVRGELFTTEAQYAFPELPSLAGPAGSEREVAARYLAVRGRLAEADLTLESLSMDERGAWRVVLGGGQEIRLGRRDIDERLYRFFDVVAPVLAGELERVKYVDLRYTNGFAVGWSAPSDAALATVSEGSSRG